MKGWIIISLLGLIVAGAYGQSGGGKTPLDKAYPPETIEDNEPLAYDHIREADVFWAKRVWRVIDTREKNEFGFSLSQGVFREYYQDLCLGRSDHGL